MAVDINVSAFCPPIKACTIGLEKDKYAEGELLSNTKWTDKLIKS